jgi:hypothetical protein
MKTPAVYYPRSLPTALVTRSATGTLVIVPLTPKQGWAQRRPYLGHEAALGEARPEKESDVMLRTLGWAPEAL